MIFLWRRLKEVFAAREILYYLALKDIKIRYKYASLGFAWAIISPLVYMVIITAVMSMIVRFEEVANYPLFLLVALLPWSYFQITLAQTTDCIIDNDNLVRKISFPRDVIPLGKSISNLFDFTISLLILLGFLVAFGVPFTRHLLLFPFVLLLQLMLTVGFSLIFSGLTVVYRDMKYVKELVLIIWFYASPIFYPASRVPASIRPFYYLNPLAGIIHIYRRIFLDGGWPSPWLSLYTLGVSTLVLYVGYRIFKHYEPHFADLV